LHQVYKNLLIVITLLLSASSLAAQSLSGSVVDDQGQAIPYANIFVKELQSGTSTDFEGKFYLALVASGEYSIVVSAIGYESKNISAVLKNTEDFKIFATLTPSTVLMNEIIVKADKKDPAYGIIRKVIEAKSKYINPVESSRSEIYLKSIEKLNLTKKKKEVYEEKTVNKDGSQFIGSEFFVL